MYVYVYKYKNIYIANFIIYSIIYIYIYKSICVGGISIPPKGMGFPSSSNPASSHIGTQTPCDRKTPRHWQPTCQGVIGEPFILHFWHVSCQKKQVSSGFAMEFTTVLKWYNVLYIWSNICLCCEEPRSTHMYILCVRVPDWKTIVSF